MIRVLLLLLRCALALDHGRSSGVVGNHMPTAPMPDVKALVVGSTGFQDTSAKSQKLSAQPRPVQTGLYKVPGFGLQPVTDALRQALKVVYGDEPSIPRRSLMPSSFLSPLSGTLPGKNVTASSPVAASSPEVLPTAKIQGAASSEEGAHAGFNARMLVRGAGLEQTHKSVGIGKAVSAAHDGPAAINVLGLGHFSVEATTSSNRSAVSIHKAEQVHTNTPSQIAEKKIEELGEALPGQAAMEAHVHETVQWLERPVEIRMPRYHWVVIICLSFAIFFAFRAYTEMFTVPRPWQIQGRGPDPLLFKGRDAAAVLGHWNPRAAGSHACQGSAAPVGASTPLYSISGPRYDTMVEWVQSQGSK